MYEYYMCTYDGLVNLSLFVEPILLNVISYTGRLLLNFLIVTDKMINYMFIKVFRYNSIFNLLVYVTSD